MYEFSVKKAQGEIGQMSFKDPFIAVAFASIVLEVCQEFANNVQLFLLHTATREKTWHFPSKNSHLFTKF